MCLARHARADGVSEPGRALQPWRRRHHAQRHSSSSSWTRSDQQHHAVSDDGASDHDACDCHRALRARAERAKLSRMLKGQTELPGQVPSQHQLLQPWALPRTERVLHLLFRCNDGREPQSGARRAWSACSYDSGATDHSVCADRTNEDFELLTGANDLKHGPRDKHHLLQPWALARTRVVLHLLCLGGMARR